MFTIVVGGGYMDNGDENDGSGDGGGYSCHGGVVVVALKMTVVLVSLVAIMEPGIKFCFLAINPRDFNYNK